MTQAESQGFTLLEVMIAAALLSIVTGGAMAAFIAQSRAINTQQQTSEGNDAAREVLRLIGNDVRTAAAGVNPGSGGFANCAQGSVPYDATGVVCLPPVFRSTTPLVIPGAIPPAAPGFADFSVAHPCYNLDFGNGVLVPAGGAKFCPDDLVVVAVDDSNPLFMVQGSANFSSVGNNGVGNTVTFAGTSPIQRVAVPAISPLGAGFGFDDDSPATYLAGAGAMMMYGGANGAVLMNTTYGGPGVGWAANIDCTAPAGGTCDAASYKLLPSTPSVDLIHNNLGFGAVALPARLLRYSIEPVDAAGNATNCPAAPSPLACVGANLIRSVILPTNAVVLPGTEAVDFTTLTSTVLMNGVVDLQVEFGLAYSQSTGTSVNGQLLYVNSGGLQSAPWIPPLAAAVPGTQPIVAPTNADNCLGGSTDPTVWPGVCFPTGGTAGTNALTSLRTVRLNLTARAGANINARRGNATQTAIAVGSVPLLQPAVQDLLTGNAEAAQWGFAGGGPFAGIPIMDGATYRQVSTEIYIRNLGWTNNL